MGNGGAISATVINPINGYMIQQGKIEGAFKVSLLNILNIRIYLLWNLLYLDANERQAQIYTYPTPVVLFAPKSTISAFWPYNNVKFAF